MARIKTVVLSGENNHDWRRSTPFCKDLLAASGRFDVTVTEDPSAWLADAGNLEGCELIFSEYNGPDWSDAARANFEAAVAGGVGLVILHAADNSFTGWVEYEKMIGLLFREGSGHGEYHEFEVKIVDGDHPITRGLSNFRTWDELYHKLVPLHGVDFHVLATAWSSPDKLGTGKDEPMMVVSRYGQGRVYHHLLGHVWPGDPNGEYKGASMISLENKDFQRSLLRGCEWAATGEVTLP